MCGLLTDQELTAGLSSFLSQVCPCHPESGSPITEESRKLKVILGGSADIYFAPMYAVYIGTCAPERRDREQLTSVPTQSLVFHGLLHAERIQAAISHSS
jgi:hypothetical protein